uniref:Uncharacterized protein n=1 Tax=Globisporangium ultimum (strain ATCC 200006 / CBS 805.95 / DAOM BR144) TaxID=431595 RepID=K3X857_GLOUD
MIPPRYVKAVSVKNTTSHPVKVTAVFGSDEQAAEGNAKITKNVDVAPHAQAALDEQEYDMGGWTAVAALESLKVEPADAGLQGALGHALFTPTVDTIVGVLHVEIQAPSDANTYHVAVVKQE